MTVVVKCGGRLGLAPETVCRDVGALHATGEGVVLVHGGAADIDALADRMAVPRRRLSAPDGMTTRYTDGSMLEVVTLALTGLTKPRLVAALHAAGVRAVGVTGLDAGLLQARRKAAHRAMVDGRRLLVHDNHSGLVTRVDTRVLDALLAAGFVPVVSPPAADQHGAPVNVNADRAAAAIAVATHARALLLLTNTAGVLADPAVPRSTIARLDVAQPPPTAVTGGMRMKLVAAAEALHGGVAHVVIGDGRAPGPIAAALGGVGSTRLTVASERGSPR